MKELGIPPSQNCKGIRGDKRKKYFIE